MENVMDEIMALCITYYYMFSAEQLVRNETDDKTREALYAGYLKCKNNFELQYKKVKDLVNE